MNAWYSTPDDMMAGHPRPVHAVLSGRVCSRRAVVDEHGHTGSVMVLEIGSRRGDTAATGNGRGSARPETYLTMLLLSGEKEGWGRSRMIGDDEALPAGGMTLVVDGTMRVCDLVRYASGVLEKGC